MPRRSLLLLAAVAVACGGGPDDRSGAPCERPGDCDDLDCVAVPEPDAADLEALPFVCSSELQGRDAGEACERPSECRSRICLLAGACAEPCGDEGDCTDFERCQRVYARGSRERLHPVEACVAISNLADGSRVHIETRAGAFSGGLDEIELAPVDEPTLFVIEHLDDDSWPVPSPSTTCRPALCADRLATAAPEPERWFDRSQLSAAEGPINPVAIGDHVHPLTVLVPNGPRSPPSAAGLRLRVESKRPGRARITRLARTPRSGQLNVNLFYAGTEAGSDVIAEALDEVDRLFEPAGIFLGDRREIRITGALLERGTDLPDAEASRGFARLRLQYRVYPQLPALLELSAGAGNRALDLFFVDRIDAGEAEVGGLAGSTPVPFGMHGTGASGVVIATAGLDGDPAQLGRRLAHEIGHALGLFHPVETNGDVLDPLPDTPADGSPGNLMFPEASTGDAELTPDQTEVIRRAMFLD